MKKTFPFIALLLCILAPIYQCLFSENPNTNITLTGSAPNKIALESSGTKFLTWNSNSQIFLYSINGSAICNITYPQQIQKILWPTEYYPIVLPFPGLQISTLNYTTCQIIKNFDLQTMINNTNTTDEIYDMTFTWRNGGPYVALSAMVSIWQIDLSSVSMINAYVTLDATLPKFQSTTYSKDFKNIYVVMTDSSSGTRTVRVWQTKTPFGKPIREITFTTSVSAMTPSNDNSTIICVGSSMSEDSTTVYRFDENGIVKSKTTKSGIAKALTIGNGNTVAMFQTGKGTMQLVRAGDGKTVQNATFSSSYFLDADFQNKVLIILDSSNRALTYSYTPDEDVQPIPDPVNPAKSFPVWIIIVSVIVGILILVVVLMYVFQEKLPQNLRKKLPKCFNKEKKEGKEPLISENSIVESVQSNPKPQPNNVAQNPPPQLYPNYPIPQPQPQPQYHPANNNGSFQSAPRQKDGIPPGLTDAQIMQSMKKQQEKRRHQEFEKRRRQQIFERQERQRKYRQEQAERQRKQYEFRRQKEWQEQQRLMEIERRRREDYERERIRREEIERIKKEEEARRYYEYQKEEERKRQEEIRRIEYQRYLEEQQRRKYQQPYPQPYQPSYQPYSQYPQSSSNPNIYVPPPQSFNPPYSAPYNQIQQREPVLQREPMPQPQKMNFSDQRKNLFSNLNQREEKPAAMEEMDDDQIPMSKSFFVVKRKDADEGVDSEIKGDEGNHKYEG